MKYKHITLLLLFLFFPFISLSQQINSMDYWGYTLKAFGSLILVVGIIFFLFFFVKKINSVGKFNNNRIKSKGRLYLDNKHYLSIVEVDGKELLIGVGENVTFLKEIESKAENENREK